MPRRQIIKIDEALCDGCGACVPSCEEGAIQIIDGKAKLVSEVYCDGLGACLGDCPQGALTLVEAEAEAFDEAAVERHLARTRATAPTPLPIAPAPPKVAPAPLSHGGGCPGSRVMTFGAPVAARASAPQPTAAASLPSSKLRQWPVQLHLVPPEAPFLNGADLLLAADCSAFAAGNFHADYLDGRALAIACPKLDHGMDVYLEKLVAMIDHAELTSITVLMMQVPCCRGLLGVTQQAMAKAKRQVPVRYIVLGIQGEVLEERTLDASSAATGTFF